MVSGTRYDFIIGHSPRVVDGCLSLKDHYTRGGNKPKVILLGHELPRNGIDELNEQLREADVVLSTNASVYEKISQLPNKPRVHKIYLPGYPVELFNLKTEVRDVQKITTMTLEKKDLKVNGLDFSLAVNSVRKSMRMTNGKMNLTMLTGKADDIRAWQGDFKQALLSKPKDLTFECNTTQNIDKLKKKVLCFYFQ